MSMLPRACRGVELLEHAASAATNWYSQARPELLALAAECLQRAEGGHDAARADTRGVRRAADRSAPADLQTVAC
jgi:hypothetical protein